VNTYSALGIEKNNSEDSQKIVYKSGDESRTSTTIADDNDLTLTLEKNSVYAIEAFLFVIGGTFKLTFAGTATATNMDIRARVHETQFNSIGFVRFTSLGGTGTNSSIGTGNNIFTCTGSIEVNAGGTFILKWASNDGTAGVLKRGSWMSFRRIK